MFFIVAARTWADRSKYIFARARPNILSETHNYLSKSLAAQHVLNGIRNLFHTMELFFIHPSLQLPLLIQIKQPLSESIHVLPSSLHRRKHICQSQAHISGHASSEQLGRSPHPSPHLAINGLATQLDSLALPHQLVCWWQASGAGDWRV